MQLYLLMGYSVTYKYMSIESNDQARVNRAIFNIQHLPYLHGGNISNPLYHLNTRINCCLLLLSR